MSGAFSKLHLKIQEAIWNQGWESLRPLQVAAIDAVLESSDHLIIAAATASGKTEAAFLPVLSQIATEPGVSVQALYLSPLKALINDQFRRLEDLCAAAEIPVHRWHGDVNASEKARLRQSPGGVLLITPESLESQFVNHDRHLRRMYAGLRFVVIDELHAFLDNVRGIHLRSLLARLNIAGGASPRRIGLSATIGDFEPARIFLCPDNPATVRVLKDDTERKELRVGLKAYVEPAEAGQQGLDPLVPGSGTTGGLSAIAKDLAERFRTGSNLIFCNSRRQTELLADDISRLSEREHWPRNPFLLHHGSLSRDLREDTERELKSGQPVTAICTSTLEMGIDLGAVRAVGQVSPTGSVASLVQRLGRSGRRADEPQILRLYTLDKFVGTNSPLSERLYPELIRGIAMLELHREGWLEPSENDRLHFSTCVHQVLSVCRQTGGASAMHLLDVLCQRGAFRNIQPTQFAALLRGLAAKQLIEQMPTGEIILAPAGERIVESRDFYAAFASRIEYCVEHDHQAIGVLPQDSLPAVGEFLLFAARRWRVELIDHGARRVAVTPARGWKQPQFGGGFGGLHAVVMARMKSVLAGSGGFAYVNEAGDRLLSRARKAFANAGLHKSNTVVGFSGVEWFPWRGDRVLRTLELCAKADRIITTRDSLSLRYQKLSVEEFELHRRRVAEGAFTPGLAALPQDLQRDRFDEYVPDSLLQSAFGCEVLDLVGAQECAVMAGSSVPVSAGLQDQENGLRARRP
jgi:ATP-dependent Lhr-like helicase